MTYLNDSRQELWRVDLELLLVDLGKHGDNDRTFGQHFET